jgi:TRAP transporter 4TM/12TM fusion protein
LIKEESIDKVTTWAVRALALCFSVYSLVEVNTFRLAPFQERALFLLFPLALCFLMKPVKGPAHGFGRKLADSVLALLGIACCAYIVLEYDDLIRRMGTPTSLDLAVGGIATLLVLESTRRLAGWALPVIALLFVLYAYGGARLPISIGGHAGYEMGRIITQCFLTMEGVFGIALSVMFVYVFPFIVFGVVLGAVGGMDFAIDLAQALFGRYKGGPAKVAVVASGMVGMINGSAVANVVTAGSLTIPMMKRIGFQPHVAAAVEAVASTGGQLMPPVMGAAAFMMAEFLGLPYLTIAKAALIPAMLYYIALFTTIHFYSVRHNIGGLEQSSQGSSLRSILMRKDLYMFVVPVVCLLGFMLSGLSATRSVSYALAATFLTSLLFKERRLTIGRIVSVLERAAYDSVSLCCASACVGIIIGLTLMTALGSRFTSIIVDLSSGSMIAALFLVMVSSVILGLGLPTTVCYVLLATLAGPALIDLGMEPLAAHMFILYFGMMSMVTPPDAMAAYAGAVIAGADMMKSAFTAWVFSLSGYLLPFMFALNPALLMIGPAHEIVLAALTGTLGVMALGAAVAGHVRAPLKLWERTALFAAAGALIHPGFVTDAIGLAFLAIVAVRQYNPFGVLSTAAGRSREL